MNSSTRKLVFAALLAALATLLSGPLSIKLNLLGGYIKNISFVCVPIVLSGCLLGPVWGGLTGAASDLVGYITNPMGAYNPGFTLTLALCGILSALIYKRQHDKPVTYARMFATTAIPYFICFTCINSCLIVALYGIRPEVIAIRAAIQCVMLPLYALLVKTLLQATRAALPSA